MLKRALTAAEIEAVLREYEVGRLACEPAPGGGTANANAVIATAGGRFFLKRRNPKYADPGCVRFDHRLMEHLASHGAPTPLALAARSGERWVERDGGIYELYPHHPGVPHNRHSVAQVAAAGRALACYHRAARSFAAPPGKSWPRYHDPRRIREGIDAIRAGLPDHLTPCDAEYLDEQVAALEREFPDARYHALPALVVHGDYHPGNLLYAGDDVCGIYDLDWATVQPRAVDLADGIFLIAGERGADTDPADIVSLTQTWTPSPAREAAFLDAYRETEPVAPAELDAMWLTVRARWMYCRVQGMPKLPEPDRVAYFAAGLLAPLRALDARR